MPVTSWPAAIRRGTSGRPTAPLAPATNTLIDAGSVQRARSSQPSSTVVSSSDTKFAGPSQSGSASPMSIRWLSECSAYWMKASPSTGMRHDACRRAMNAAIPSARYQEATSPM